MVNEGDGKIHPGNKLPRSQENIVNIHYLYIDTDKCPPEKVLNYLNELNIIPERIVTSSPGRKHIYIKIHPILPSENNIRRWRDVQNILMRLGNPAIINPGKDLGTDSTMTDYARLLRVPGYTHISKKKHSTIR
jgi:hypothetical protein